MLWTTEICLYSIQCVTLVFGIIMLKRLCSLSKARPQCSTGLCTKDTSDKALCQECDALVGVLDQRIPIILQCFVFYLIIFICNFAMYTG